jgi:hypothetical protein
MLRARTRALNCSRSASLTTNAVLGLPIRLTSHTTLADLTTYVKLLMGRHTRALLNCSDEFGNDGLPDCMRTLVVQRKRRTRLLISVATASDDCDPRQHSSATLLRKMPPQI